GGQESPERRLAVVADGLIQAREGAIALTQERDLIDVQLGGLGDLLVARRLAVLGGQLALDASDAPRTLGHVGGQADRAAGVVEAALKRLTDPDRRVRGEPVA